MARSTTVGVLVLLLAAPAAYAEPLITPAGTNIRASMDKIRFDDLPDTAASARQFRRQKPISSATKASVAFVGGFAGFFAGGLLGAKLAPDCYCDDPGLRGFMIGGSIGAVVGAIAAYKLISR